VLARTFVDLLRFDRIDERTLWRLLSIGEVRDLASSAGGGAAIFVSAHFGNWELLLLGLRRCGVVLHAVARDQSNAAADRGIKAARARAGVRTLSSRTGLREAVRALRRGESVTTLLDQDAGGKGLFVDFLGAKASCHSGMVALAARTGNPMVPVLLVDERGTYRVAPGGVWRADPALSQEENVRAGVEHFQRFLEAQVRAHPGNYLWAHRRWKTRPPGEPTDARR
jgi:KDO2-lipid IV(A) lauroyltransferase